MARPTKRRKLSLEIVNGSASTPTNGIPERGNADWSEEQAYERRPRNQTAPRPTRLPIKTSEGWIVQALPQEEMADVSDSLAASDTESVGNGNLSEAEAEVDSSGPPRQQVKDAKEEMARLAALIAEDPEAHVGALRDLAAFSSSRNQTVTKLALATQCAVYRDLIPGYRIRPLSEEGMKEKLSKDVRKLRAFEQSMVKAYQGYIQQLQTFAKASVTAHDTGIPTVALSCACTLLVERPHFNFRPHLLAIVVRRLARRTVDEDYRKSIDAIQTLFQQDEEGHASLDAVTVITKLLKSQKYQVNELVVNTFLHLRLMSEFAGTGSHDRIDKAVESLPPTDVAKRKQQFRTKKQRKHMRELKKVEKEMKEADATVSKEDRDRIQGEILKLVFATYFRILKTKSPELMGATLEGLAKYAHLINQDFFGDIIEALKELIVLQNALGRQDNGEDDDTGNESTPQSSANVARETLLCVITAFALLQGQHGRAVGSTLNLDLESFVTHLYKLLYPAAMDVDLEYGATSLHLPDPGASQAQLLTTRRKINVQTTTVLLIRSLSSVLLPAVSLRAVPPLRLAAFTKQLFTTSLQLPEKTCLATLSLLERVAKLHGRKVSALWYSEERRGDGVFDPLTAEIESSNPFAATVWEGELLRLHYAPKVRLLTKAVRQQIVSL